MSRDAPSLHRVSTNTTADDVVELKWDRSSDDGLDSTFSLEDGSSAGSSDTDPHELAIFDRDDDGDESRKRERRRGRRRNIIDVGNGEEEARRRRRRLVVMALSVIPFLVALTSLVSMATKSPSDDDDKPHYAFARNDVAESPTPLQGDAPTYAPTSAASSTLIPVMSPETLETMPDTTTDQPSPRPTEAATTESTFHDGETHGGLRATMSPTAGPDATWEQQEQLSTSRPPTLHPMNPVASPLTSSPTTTPTTLAPSSSAPTASPTEFCVKVGATCPKKHEGSCCSDVCAKSKETGERVCAQAESEAEEEDDPTTACVQTGSACPNDKNECCSGRCSAGKGKVCL
eukprot:CAMPEP_0172570836 /NCGR_PEP_ID=MMETSP1067-20121228/129118_1 /TAXON_ID=265564 ORGANISM="Thalassiosira punctigera, Strain Tpunct2005C2" /NCGR_SAMPLE_ID=MMETSP1067 /ASSEMBLY_ACC=CAM_ASM_000444 /LENGTH=345 /DNA_ID=CAMNT_0013363029 /DNA_START=101 /DNA_END=1138 /DNA_ORIENTATION=+